MRVCIVLEKVWISMRDIRELIRRRHGANEADVIQHQRVRVLLDGERPYLSFASAQLSAKISQKVVYSGDDYRHDTYCMGNSTHGTRTAWDGRVLESNHSHPIKTGDGMAE